MSITSLGCPPDIKDGTHRHAVVQRDGHSTIYPTLGGEYGALCVLWDGWVAAPG